MEIMDLYDVMRTNGAIREYTDDPLPDGVLGRILDNARFAPSGGMVRNRKRRATRSHVSACSSNGPSNTSSNDRSATRSAAL